jgi:hypothetical protein
LSADEEAERGGQPSENAPNADVCVPHGSQVAAAKYHAEGGRGKGAEDGRRGAGSYALRQQMDMQRLKPWEHNVTGQSYVSAAFRHNVTLIEKLDVALEALSPHAKKRGGGMQQDEKAGPAQSCGVALSVRADARGFRVPAPPVTHVSTGTRT